MGKRGDGKKRRPNMLTLINRRSTRAKGGEGVDLALKQVGPSLILFLGVMREFLHHYRQLRRRVTGNGFVRPALRASLHAERSWPCSWTPGH